MLATFDDFIEQNQNCKKFEDDITFQKVFDFLSWDVVLIQMIDASESGKPAITPVATNIEHFFLESKQSTLDDDFTKQAVGRMVKTILAPFGYVVDRQKNLPKNARATKFTSAAVYRFDQLAPRSMKMVKRIEEIA